MTMAVPFYNNWVLIIEAGRFSPAGCQCSSSWCETGWVPAVYGQYGTKIRLQHDVKSEQTLVASKASAP